MAHKRPTKRKPTSSKRKLLKAYFPPTQANRVEAQADREGLSTSAWLVKTVLHQLEQEARQ